MNLNKAGIVGSKHGDSSKRAFLVAFLMQGSKKLPRRLRRRMKRSTTETYPETEEHNEAGVDESMHRRSVKLACAKIFASIFNLQTADIITQPQSKEQKVLPHMKKEFLKEQEKREDVKVINFIFINTPYIYTNGHR